MFENLKEHGPPPGAEVRRNPLDEEVEVIDVALPYWQAWHALCGQRPVGGMGAVGEIRRESVTDWLNEEQIFASAERALYRSILGKLDRLYLDEIGKRTKAEADKIAKSQPRVRTTQRVRR